MASKLSHELIHIILSLPGVCGIDDDEFIDTSLLSRTTSVDRSVQTSVIHVSKSWFCVGTPLFYETIVLHSQKQAQALLYALRKTPSLGTHVRKLRLHGSFGLTIGHIIRACPRITDLFISLALTPKDNVQGLCTAFPDMNPTRLIIWDPDPVHRTIKSIKTVTEALLECLPKWSSLVRRLILVHFLN